MPRSMQTFVRNASRRSKKVEEIVEFGVDEVSLRCAEIGEGHEFEGTL